ncbi:MAG TPA: hypothetical protein EYP16_07190 [Candidatus Atribacteria bacterium]|nr:hypothetical protein [Candidatus Atribacteria bacterium]
MRFPKKVVYLNIVLYILLILMIIISTTQVLQIKNIINISLFIISVFALLTYLSVSFSLKNIFLRLKETDK